VETESRKPKARNKEKQSNISEKLIRQSMQQIKGNKNTNAQEYIF
jgi:hypothetical protein